MSCSCGVEGKTAGCNNNGGCATGSCNKLNTFDWLSNMDIPSQDRFDIVEVRFKNGRKDFYRNTNKLDVVTGEAVIVDVQGGHHMGFISLQGELVRLQMKKKGVKDDDQIRQIYRKASTKDLEQYEEAKKREMPALYRTRNIILEQKLAMKLTDIEFQSDNTKATFFYSADERVDFRELIKILASEFKIRVEMRQISLRQEAGRLGGIGSCGRELCCSTWLTEFKSVSTSAARYQNLSLNPSKLSGQCGRLKCCLNYELDTYMEALEDIPEVTKLKTKKGDAKLEKTDIFRKLMWFSFAEENTWYPIATDRVKEIIALNKKGELPETLTEDVFELEVKDTAINRDLERMDEKFRKKANRNKRKPKPRNNKNRGGQNPNNKSTNQQPKAKQQGQGQGGQKQRPNQNNGGSKPQNSNQNGNKKPKNKRFKRKKKTNDQ
ncbi:cell fate regulator YaaT (PSP1 superfamily) [Roseivirga pacifica]|uniref:Cell fate regulator YaaT, PSP1 superfamily (Controls sporulation, competence, biofilm development) n=1 Tax=Roseivirga pacifica TaxID=1267423 RepID=A0A1I0M988_9BACT|nr:regulatory iron-sulfur-containing complex subunit RicT [Roseivirga pacifica]RKQ50193.1 cell fate regulator YaaT (PSP1 superfamily) [Roseivirga pacifica]SEV84913.1 Cell fate regulator YaaT, PSP1 superfamily (controls sporulation, competence, biofilm development) [Roseivirga pacifica]